MKLPKYLKGCDHAGQGVKYKNWTIEYLWAEIPFLVELNQLMDSENMEFPLDGKVVEQLTAKVFDGARSEKENRGWDIKCGEGKKWEVRARNMRPILQVNGSTICTNSLHFGKTARRHWMGKGVTSEDNSAESVKEKMSEVDGYIIVDIADWRPYSELHFWKIPSMVIKGLYDNKGWIKSRKGKPARRANPDVSCSVFKNTMESLGLNTVNCG
jgi:hypothetical protein